jgi:hypothetical protein
MDVEGIGLTEDLHNYNQVKECIIDALIREEFITEEQGTNIKSSYVVMLVKGNWFGRTIAKLINKETTVIKFMKIV